jgi:hypothetical protein
MMKSRMMSWERHVARMDEEKNACRNLVAKSEGMRPFGRVDVGGWIILKWILKGLVAVVWTGSIWLRMGTTEHGNEPSVSIRYWEILE